MPEDSIVIPYINARTNIPPAVSSLAREVARATSDTICPIYRTFPSIATGEFSNNPFAKINDRNLRDLCYPPDMEPNYPPPPFTGGQCQNVRYRVSYTAQFPGSPAFDSDVLVWGAVGGIRRINGTNAQNQPNVRIDITGGIIPGTTQQDVQNITGNANPGTTASITGVVPLDGGPDLCGDTPNHYPREQPPDNIFNTNANLTLAPNLTIAVPVAIFAPITTFRPSLKIGDFNVDFNLGGLTISPSINPTFNFGTPSSTPPPQRQPGDTPEDRNKPCDTTDLLKYLKFLRDCAECDRDYNFLTVTSTANQSGELIPPAGSIVVAVGFNITSSPTNRRVELGFNAADVIYGGWGWFNGNDYLYTREPIDSEFKLFIAPRKPAVNSFEWTLRKGFSGIAVLTYKVLKNPLPPV